MVLLLVLVFFFGSLCSRGHNDAGDFHSRASLTISVIIEPDTFDFATFAFITDSGQKAHVLTLIMHTMLRTYISRASNANFQARRAQAFSATNLTMHCCSH
jgi:hypothetical protein